MNLLEQAKRFYNGVPILAEWLGPDGISVSQEIAQFRTDICLRCDFNKPGNFITESVAAAIKSEKELRIGLGLRTNGIKELKTCQACTCPLPSKIWIPLSRLLIGEDSESLAKYDPKCWMRNETP